MIEAQLEYQKGYACLFNGVSDLIKQAIELQQKAEAICAMLSPDFEVVDRKK